MGDIMEKGDHAQGAVARISRADAIRGLVEPGLKVKGKIQ
jgi:hypothetical protein